MAKIESTTTLPVKYHRRKGTNIGTKQYAKRKGYHQVTHLIPKAYLQKPLLPVRPLGPPCRPPCPTPCLPIFAFCFIIYFFIEMFIQIASKHRGEIMLGWYIQMWQLYHTINEWRWMRTHMVAKDCCVATLQQCAKPPQSFLTACPSSCPIWRARAAANYLIYFCGTIYRLFMAVSSVKKNTEN